VKRNVTNGPVQGSNETGRTFNCLVSKVSADRRAFLSFLGNQT
jgi:hypothetical protein